MSKSPKKNFLNKFSYLYFKNETIENYNKKRKY